MNTNTALVIGANGIIGRHLTGHLMNSGKWNVLASARSGLNYETTADFIALDLEDKEALDLVADQLKAVTHVFFNAYTERKTPYEQSEANLKILSNLVPLLEKNAPGLQRILFIQGGKAYGAHLGIYKTPAYETDLRSITPNFYYAQEDYLRKQSAGKNWSWTAIRPDIVIGFTVGTPMNLANLIAAYATLCKEEGIPMRFPGSPKAYEVLVNVTGTEILSKSLEWAALQENAANEIFNITNGDVFRWSQVWPKIGEFFGVEVAEPQTFSMQEYMPGKRNLWAEIIKKYNLENYDLDTLVQWGFGDFVFNVEVDAFLDVNKARRFGFHEMNGDSLKIFLDTFKQLKDKRIIA
ncbi:nucleoside-diphosphate-sugar epimerase [Pedobacter cryoconitis]|uniref:Nucleoside-diphosphate-sugar epimerase n=1 Tax=Pedobacter cryoconitis TaxID=188932 RepID=A0A7W8ZI79_9SPHI|nr:SDR family oxidoreductase [Pedobacter cryoconitis]MBB5634385.1 nucleoside-diphosphate-sugar epimerase [Pedobacter cryoconitis]